MHFAFPGLLVPVVQEELPDGLQSIFVHLQFVRPLSLHEEDDVSDILTQWYEHDVEERLVSNMESESFTEIGSSLVAVRIESEEIVPELGPFLSMLIQRIEEVATLESVTIIP